MQASLISGATPQCDPIVRLGTSRVVRFDWPSLATNSAREGLLCLGCRLSLWLQQSNTQWCATRARTLEQIGARLQDADHVTSRAV